jgi:flavin reductase (DIM6/NTAB) family NADH-FMN oxidoreductase RutF
MDQRDDASRVSVDTLTDWHRIKATYTSAALAQLEARVASSYLTQERDVLLLHLKKVANIDDCDVFRPLIYDRKFIETTFLIAQPNLRVNGRNFEELGENEEG